MVLSIEEKKESKTTLKYNVSESLVSRILVEYKLCSYNGVNKLGQAFQFHCQIVRKPANGIMAI